MSSRFRPRCPPQRRRLEHTDWRHDNVRCDTYLHLHHAGSLLRECDGCCDRPGIGKLLRDGIASRRGQLRCCCSADCNDRGERPVADDPELRDPDHHQLRRSGPGSRSHSDLRPRPDVRSTGSACSVTSAGAVTILAVGTCQITASQAGNSTYAAATPVVETLTVNPAADVITIPPTVPSTTTVGANVTIGATTTSGLPPTYTSTTPAFCSVSSTGVITATAIGTCSVSVTQPAAGNYAAATPQTVTLTVSGATNTITFPALPNTPFTSTPPVTAATATSGQPVTYSTATAACSVTPSGVVTFNSIGTCSITANQAATGTYAAATPVTQSFLIMPGVDAIVVPPTVPANSAPGTTVPIGATSTSGGPSLMSRPRRRSARLHRRAAW